MNRDDGSHQADSSSPPSKAAGPAPKGERRVVTVLFCDVVGSTAMAEQLDPEEWAEIINEAFQYLIGPVARYEGTIARLMGDAILALFGAPVGHEDDPQRAVLAGLDIISGIQPFREQIKREYGMDFDVRVGINTGPVVVGDIGSNVAMEYTAMGDAVNVAARMEQTAQPGTIQISEDTHRLVSRAFDTESLGGIEMKGKGEPVESYRIVGLKEAPGPKRGLAGVSAPLIGRSAELEQLKAVLDGLRQGRGQVVCLIGEAGLGKSRLIGELRKEWLTDHPPSSWEVSEGVPYDSSRPFGLFQNFARNMFGIHLDDTAEVIHKKVETMLLGFGGDPEQVDLCAVTMERVVAAKVLTESTDFPSELIKQDLYEIAYPAWRSTAESGPVVMVIDDLQWSDQASVGLLKHLFQLVEEVPTLFLCAFRPERGSPAWEVKMNAETDYPHRYTEITLHPLDADRTDELVSALLKIADLPPELRQLIIRKTDGNPYFVEEVVRTLIEQGAVYPADDGLHWRATTKIEDIALPDTLQALLLARIDRLDAEARSTLQLASVIGRSFYLRILQAISDSTLALDKQLSSLERVDLIQEAARQPELQYIFKHELARDATYSSILRRRRRELHRGVGEAMETLFEATLEANAHRLAYHFDEAGDDERALRFYRMAAESAVAVDAQPEAAGHYGHAIEVATRLGAPANEVAELKALYGKLLVVDAN